VSNCSIRCEGVRSQSVRSTPPRTTPRTVGSEFSEAQAGVVVEFRRSEVLEGFEIGDESLSFGSADAPVAVRFGGVGGEFFGGGAVEGVTVEVVGAEDEAVVDGGALGFVDGGGLAVGDVAGVEGSDWKCSHPIAGPPPTTSPTSTPLSWAVSPAQVVERISGFADSGPRKGPSGHRSLPKVTVVWTEDLTK